MVHFIHDLFGNYEVIPYTNVTLGEKDKVQRGIFPNNITKVETILKRFGKEGVIKLLHYYDLDDKILHEYHILKREDVIVEKKDMVQEENIESTPVEDGFETTATLILDEETQDLIISMVAKHQTSTLTNCEQDYYVVRNIWRNIKNNNKLHI